MMNRSRQNSGRGDSGRGGPRLSGRAIWNRRRFLQCAGASALTLPFLKALPGYAQDVTEKRYLLMLFTPNGVVRHLWGMNQIGATPHDIELRPWLAPLEPFKHLTTCVVGLENKAANGGTHEAGLKTLWTGTTADASTDNFGTGTSIDQAIASELNAGTTYDSLHFRAVSKQDYAGANVENRMIHNGGVPIDPLEEPFDAFDALFKNAVLPSADAPGEMPAEPDQRAQLRRKLFTHLDGELSRLQPRLCNEDAVHLDALRGAWNNLALRLDGGGSGQASVECAQPDLNNLDAPADFPFTVLQNIELLTMSLACDFTRVASLQFSSARSPMVPDWLGINQEHHDVSHQVPQAVFLGPEETRNPDPDNPTAAQLASYAEPIDMSTKINLFYSTQIALLVDKLNNIPVAGGKTLLDQCTICWGNELDNGNSHNFNNMPFTLIGGGAGRLNAGQLVQLPVLSTNAEKGTAERAHNDLLVTLAQVMGVNIQTYGDGAFNSGPITELLL